MDLHLTDEQADLLVAELDQIIDGDRYFLSPRIQALREIRAMLKPYPAAQPATEALRAAEQGPISPPPMTPYRGPPLTLGDAAAARLLPL